MPPFGMSMKALHIARQQNFCFISYVFLFFSVLDLKLIQFLQVNNVDER